MAEIIFVDIPVLAKEWQEPFRGVVALKYKAQDLLYAKNGFHFPFQRGKRQFTTGLLTMSTYLKQRGHNVGYVHHDSEDLEERIGALSPGSFVGIGTITAFMPEVKRVCELVRRANPDVRIVLGGYHASALPEDTFDYVPDVDVLVCGEGERPIAWLLEGTTSEDVETREHEGHLIMSTRKQLIPEDLPVPDYALLPGHLSNYNFNVQTTRGCNFRCNFCVNGFFWDGVRYRPLESVKEELSFLATHLEEGRFIHFSDNNFLLSPGRADEICDYLIEKGIRFDISCDLRAGSYDSELIQKMDRAGFKRVCIGFEDANNVILGRAKKGVSVEEGVRTAQLIRRNSEKILVEAYWMTGMPGSTQQSLQRNMDVVGELLDTKVIDFVATSTVFTPLPGSPYFQRPGDFGVKIMSRNWRDYLRTNFLPVYELEGLTQRELSDHFITFERFLLDKYATTLQMSPQQIEEHHAKLFGGHSR